MSSAGRQLAGAARSWVKLHNLIVPCRWTTTMTVPTTDMMDDFAARLVDEKARKWRKKISPGNREQEPAPPYSVNSFIQQDVTLNDNPMKSETESLSKVEQNILSLLAKSKHVDVEDMLIQTVNMKPISEDTLTKQILSYSNTGDIDRAIFLQKYCERVHPRLYSQSGQFVHLIAKAHCLRGNPEYGLSILIDVYQSNVKLRGLYRSVLRELVQDSVSNRSVASLVVFKKYVVRWSETYNDHFPLVCFWHSCWVSTWFSDQTLADELIDSHKTLRRTIEDRASVLSVTALRYFKDDDAVVRLLQTLLKYKMMAAYTSVLQILFNFRLKNRDKRGCVEILENCKTLGITLPSNLQGKYIHMIIDVEHTVGVTQSPHKSPTVENFKLKF